MSISRIVLFISTVSRPSLMCLKIIREAGMQLDVVRLDTKRDRAVAKNRKLPIHQVPALLICYDNGMEQIYIGIEKIVKVLRLDEVDEPEEIFDTPSIEIPSHKADPGISFKFAGDDSPKSNNPPSSISQRGGKKKSVTFQEPDEDEDPIVLFNPEDEEAMETINFEDTFPEEEVPIQTKSKPSSQQTMNFRPSEMEMRSENIADLARQMERQREQSIPSDTAHRRF